MISKQYYFALFLIVILFSCKPENQQLKPDKLIPHEKMIPLLVDIHIADAVLTKGHYKVKADTSRKLSLYNSIFLKYKITRKQFDESIAYYTGNPLEMEDIYDKVLEEFSKKESEVDKELKKNPPASTDEEE